MGVFKLFRAPERTCNLSNMKTSPEQRFHRYYIPEPNSGCWLWTGALMKNGYGVFDFHKDRLGLPRKSRLAHRISYELHNGEIPKGLDLDHLCRTRCCVNPDHLEPVSRKENLRRSPLVNKTHCKSGHEFTFENTWIEKNGARHCRACHVISERFRRAMLR